jgi:O-acetylserine/cysteine efflux transporter
MLIAATWGVNNLFAKLIVEAFPPMYAAGLRFVLTALLLLPLLRWPQGQWRALGLICLLIGPLHFGVQYLGLGMAHDLSPMVVAMQLWIPASVVAAMLLLGERVSGLRLAGIVLSFAGIGVLAFDPSVFTQLAALALIGFAACAYGTGAALVRRNLSLNPIQMQGWIAVISAPFLFGVSAASETGQLEAGSAAPWWVWAMIAFGAIASSIWANAEMFRLVQKYEVSRTTPYVLLSPLIGIGLGVVVLHDPVSPQLWVGGAVALFGVALVALAEQRGR